MRELDEELVDPPPLLEECNGAVRLNYAQKDGARCTSRTRAERSRWSRNPVAKLRHVGLTSYCFRPLRVLPRSATFAFAKSPRS
jgi:hypothetical protein